MRNSYRPIKCEKLALWIFFFINDECKFMAADVKRL